MRLAILNTQRLPQKLLRVIHKVFLKTSVICGFGSITRYRRTQKRLKLQRWKASAGAAGHTNKRTMKRRNVEQCQRLGMVDCYSPLSTSYAMNCAQRYASIQRMKEIESRATFALHDHSTGFSLRHRSCHKARFRLGRIEAIHLIQQPLNPSESLLRRCAPKRQQSVST